MAYDGLYSIYSLITAAGVDCQHYIRSYPDPCTHPSTLSSDILWDLSLMLYSDTVRSRCYPSDYSNYSCFEGIATNNHRKFEGITTNIFSELFNAKRHTFRHKAYAKTHQDFQVAKNWKNNN